MSRRPDEARRASIEIIKRPAGDPRGSLTNPLPLGAGVSDTRRQWLEPKLPPVKQQRPIAAPVSAVDAISESSRYRCRVHYCPTTWRGTGCRRCADEHKPGNRPRRRPGNDPWDVQLPAWIDKDDTR